MFQDTYSSSQAQWRRLVRRGLEVVDSQLEFICRDGDHYTLIWDSRLVINENNPPMDYTPPTPQRVDRSITMDDVKAVRTIQKSTEAVE
jgi:hypothetical protein